MTVIFAVAIFSSAHAQETSNKNDWTISDKNGDVSSATGWNHWFKKNHDKKSKIKCKDCEGWFFCSEDEYKSFLKNVTRLPFETEKYSDDQFIRTFKISDSLLFKQWFLVGKSKNYRRTIDGMDQDMISIEDTTITQDMLSVVINDTTSFGDPLFINFILNGQMSAFRISCNDAPDDFDINNDYDYYYIRNKILPFFGEKSEYCAACNQKMKEKADIALAKEIADSKIKASYKDVPIPIETFAMFDINSKAIPVNFKCVVKSNRGYIAPGKGYLYVDTKSKKIHLVGQFTRQYKGRLMEVVLNINKSNIDGCFDIASFSKGKISKAWNKKSFNEYWMPSDLTITISDNSIKHIIEQCNETAPYDFFYSGWIKGEGQKKFNYFVAQYFGN